MLKVREDIQHCVGECELKKLIAYKRKSAYIL
jgi:hypothetical protein